MDTPSENDSNATSDMLEIAPSPRRLAEQAMSGDARASRARLGVGTRSIAPSPLRQSMLNGPVPNGDRLSSNDTTGSSDDVGNPYPDTPLDFNLEQYSLQRLRQYARLGDHVAMNRVRWHEHCAGRLNVGYSPAAAAARSTAASARVDDFPVSSLSTYDSLQLVEEMRMWDDLPLIREHEDEEPGFEQQIHGLGNLGTRKVDENVYVPENASASVVTQGGAFSAVPVATPEAQSRPSTAICEFDRAAVMARLPDTTSMPMVRGYSSQAPSERSDIDIASPTGVRRHSADGQLESRPDAPTRQAPSVPVIEELPEALRQATRARWQQNSARERLDRPRLLVTSTTQQSEELVSPMNVSPMDVSFLNRQLPADYPVVVSLPTNTAFHHGQRLIQATLQQDTQDSGALKTTYECDENVAYDRQDQSRAGPESGDSAAERHDEQLQAGRGDSVALEGGLDMQSSGDKGKQRALDQPDADNAEAGGSRR